jgi:hypothetical protein
MSVAASQLELEPGQEQKQAVLQAVEGKMSGQGPCWVAVVRRVGLVRQL